MHGEFILKPVYSYIEQNKCIEFYKIKRSWKKSQWPVNNFAYLQMLWYTNIKIY